MKSQEQTPRLLDQVRDVMRLHHYSIHTERSYTDWIKRYIHFHHMRSREDLATGYTHVLQQGGQGVPSPLDDLTP
jgi:hypothetical protein